ncbi:MAG: ABC transporter ATP-binding protein [Actinomycetota bacterium]|nr:ABC transporter ATP-binding protein [Actinomycetota bacterium]
MSSRIATHAVLVDGLVKRYPKSPVNAVDGLSFAVDAGEVFGLLGPNGAGKTTTVGILTTRVRPTAGTAEVGGVDVAVSPVLARSQFAVVPQRNNLDRSLSVRNNLIFHAAYHGVGVRERDARADELLEQFGLADRAKDKPDFFSGGQTQRMMIARALMHAPAVLFLDEPTTGLDPAARLFVWDRLRELEGRGVTLVLTTHDMDEAAALATRVGIMDKGRLLALDTPEALMRSLPGSTTLELTTQACDASATDDILAALATFRDVEKVEQLDAPDGLGNGSGGRDLRVLLYVASDAPRLVAPVASMLAARGHSLTDVRLGTATLEDVFIQLTGKSLQ